MFSFTVWVAAIFSSSPSPVQTDLTFRPISSSSGFGRPDVAADVVVADQGDVVGGLRFGKLAGADDVVADGVVGDMVAQRLGNAAEPLAVAGDDRDVQLLGGLLGNRVDVVADQTDRTFGEDRDPLGQREQLLGLFQQRLQLLVAAVDDILFLEIGGELHGEAGRRR